MELSNSWIAGQDEVIRILKQIITVENICGTDLISIRVRHTPKRDAVAIAKAVALNYQRSFPGKVVIHEAPMEPTNPVSPNLILVLFTGGLLGLILSPLLAFILIIVLQRIIPETRPLRSPSLANQQTFSGDQVVEKVKQVRDGTSRIHTHVDSYAVTSFVCGVASWIFGPLGSLPAIIFGHFALSRIKASSSITGRGYATRRIS
ncbi:MAG: DUF4190 domain-containing protein [Akkermansiaceae bacterium]